MARLFSFVSFKARWRNVARRVEQARYLKGKTGSRVRADLIVALQGGTERGDADSGIREKVNNPHDTADLPLFTTWKNSSKLAIIQSTMRRATRDTGISSLPLQLFGVSDAARARDGLINLIFSTAALVIFCLSLFLPSRDQSYLQNLSHRARRTSTCTYLTRTCCFLLIEVFTSKNLQ